MSKSLPDFVSEEPVSTPVESVEAAPVLEAAPPAQAEASTEAPADAGRAQPRGADGKFAPVAADAAPAPQAAPPVAQPVAAEAAPPPAPPAPEPPPPIPLGTALEWRDRMAAAEREAKELREWRAQQERQAQANPPPTFFEDPDAAAAHQRSQFEQAIFETRRDISRRFAEQQHGKDTVEAAYTWAADQIDRDIKQYGRSALNDAVLRSSDPVEHVVAQWRRDQIASKVDPTEFETFLAWKQGQQAQPAAVPGSPAPVPPAAIPPQLQAPRASLASAPSAATSAAPLPRDGASTYGAMFGPQ